MNISDTRYQLDREWIRTAFDRAATGYDDAARLQHEVNRRLIERLEFIKLAPQQIVDIGSGTGSGSHALGEHFPDAQLLSLDLAPLMLKEARQRCRERSTYLCADAEQLPLANDSVDMIFSNLTLQWCDLDRAFSEFRRILRPDGLLLFTTFGPDTLRELRQSWRTIDDATHVNSFIDMHDIGDALLRATLADPVMDTENLTLTYPEVLQVMRELKAMGAHNVTAGRRRSLTGRGRLKQLSAAYEKFRREDGTLPATYEVIYGHAWGSSANKNSEQKRDADGNITFPLSRLRQNRRGR